MNHIESTWEIVEESYKKGWDFNITVSQVGISVTVSKKTNPKVDAYQNSPTFSAIPETILETLKKAINSALLAMGDIEQ